MMLSRYQTGFTLLELLIVVAILSSVAFMSLSVVENNNDQIRFEDTRNRLQVFRKAILGSDNLWPQSNSTLSGYVVDSGLLPANIDSLINLPVNFDAFQNVTPQFDPVPDGNGINNGPAAGVGAEIELNNSQQTLFKGHRGFYLEGTANNQFRDGWGTDRTASGAANMDCPTVPGAGNEGNDVDANNHGWCLTLSGNGFFVDSYGTDGQAGQLTGGIYEQDIAMDEPVQAIDWQANVFGINVQVVNLTGADIDLGAAGFNTKLRASLLIYVNDTDQANEFNWRRISTDSTVDECLDGNDDGLCAGAPALSETTANFSVNANVPIGEHLLVLVEDSDDIVNTADDTTVLPFGTTGFAVSRIKFFPRGGTPNMKLIIR